MQKANLYLPFFGSAFVVSMLVLLYYERKRKQEEAFVNEEVKGDGCKNKVEEHENGIHGNGDILLPVKQENVDDVTPSSSVTSYSSLEDEDSEMKSCRATNSSTSAYSTASDDTCPFPVGEFSTYKQQTADKDLTDFDLVEILNSPVVENHNIDDRMNRSPTKHCVEFAKFNKNMDTTDIPVKVESTNCNSIIVAYSDIVPPLCPNTGETIRPSNMFKV